MSWPQCCRERLLECSNQTSTPAELPTRAYPERHRSSYVPCIFVGSAEALRKGQRALAGGEGGLGSRSDPSANVRR